MICNWDRVTKHAPVGTLCFSLQSQVSATTTTTATRGNSSCLESKTAANLSNDDGKEALSFQHFCEASQNPRKAVAKWHAFWAICNERPTEKRPTEEYSLFIVYCVCICSHVTLCSIAVMKGTIMKNALWVNSIVVTSFLTYINRPKDSIPLLLLKCQCNQTIWRTRNVPSFSVLHSAHGRRARDVPIITWREGKRLHLPYDWAVVPHSVPFTHLLFINGIRSTCPLWFTAYVFSFFQIWCWNILSTIVQIFPLIKVV